MNKSTPISHLQNQQQFNQNDNIVNDILKEIETTNNQQQQQPPMNPEFIQQNQPQFNQMEQQHAIQQDLQMQQEQQQFQEHDNHLEQMGQPNIQMNMQQGMEHNHIPFENTQYYQEDMSKNIFDMVLEEGKLPLIVSLLVITFNIKQLDSSVIKFIPKALGEDGDITWVGLCTKGLFAGLIFYLLKKFI